MSNRWFLSLLVLGLMLSPALVRGQDQPRRESNDSGQRDQGRGGGRGNFDPAQWRQRMEEQMKQDLGATDDEWKVIQPKLEKVSNAQRGMRGGMFGMMGGRGRGGPGGDRGPGGDQPQSPVSQASSDLQKVLENKDASAEQIASKLTALREAREKAKVELAAAQKDLKEVLTARQEAVLVVRGLLD